MAIQAHSRRSHEMQSNRMISNVPVKTERTNHIVNPSDATTKTNVNGTGKFRKIVIIAYFTWIT